MYINPPFNYTGSKYKLLDQLIPKFDTKKKIFIDLFCGGGSVFVNVLDKYEHVLANDVIKDLISIHQKLIVDTQGFTDKVSNLCVSRTDKEGFHKLRDDYNSEKTPEKLFALMLCSTNNFLRFNKNLEYNQTFGKRTINDNTYRKIELYAAHAKKYAGRLSLVSGGFQDVPVDPNAFYYLDPPYSGTEAGYNAYWSRDDDFNLFEYMVSLNHNNATFALSGVERVGEPNHLLKVMQGMTKHGFHRYELKNDYKKVSRREKGEDIEVLYTNYEIDGGEK